MHDDSPQEVRGVRRDGKVKIQKAKFWIDVNFCFSDRCQVFALFFIPRKVEKETLDTNIAPKNFKQFYEVAC